MKSPVAHGAGNVNLKGKKYRLLPCRCCVVIDKRDEIRYKEDKKEISALVDK